LQYKWLLSRLNEFFEVRKEKNGGFRQVGKLMPDGEFRGFKRLQAGIVLQRG
jgi:hypothetical protein